MGKDATKKDITTSQNLATGALSYTTSIGRKFRLQEVAIHFSVAVTETVTVTRDSITGANYDPPLSKRSMVAEQDFLFRPQGECDFQDGDEVKVQCTQANLTGTAYVTIKTREIN